MSTTIAPPTTDIEILRELVSLSSFSAQSNLPVIDFATELLESHGWHTERLVYASPDGTPKANLVAVPRQFRDVLPEVDLAFVCHTDTVPYSTAWPAALELQERDGHLHGCGSCDVKGSLACMLAAALQVETASLARPVAFVMTADEEIGCLGATKLVTSEIVRPKRAVICEPTSLRPAIAGKGYGLAEVTITGREAHSAFPAKGVSALQVAAQMLLALPPDTTSAALPQDPLFNPPHTTVNVGVLQGGTAKNIIPGSCTFLVEWRSLPNEPPTAGGERAQAIGREIQAKNPESIVEVKILRADPGFPRPAESKLGTALSTMLHRDETGISFGSEATRFAKLAEEVVVIGPGDMQTAHSERECVPIAELHEWTEAIRALLLHPVL